MSQKYLNFPKFCDLSVKVAPDLKEKNRFFVAKIFNFSNYKNVSNGKIRHHLT